VHTFLHRHLFVDTRYIFGLRRSAALYTTFLVSIVLHELIIWAMLAPTFPPPALALLSVSQFPLMQLMASRHLKGKVLGNVFYWASLQLGLALVITLYGRAYVHELRKLNAS